MGSLSRLAKKCRECPFVEKCDKKEMEAVGYLAEPSAESFGEPAAAPMLRETMTICVNGEPQIVYKDEIEEAIRQSINRHFGLQSLRGC